MYDFLSFCFADSCRTTFKHTKVHFLASEAPARPQEQSNHPLTALLVTGRFFLQGHQIKHTCLYLKCFSLIPASQFFSADNLHKLATCLRFLAPDEHFDVNLCISAPLVKSNSVNELNSDICFNVSVCAA